MLLIYCTQKSVAYEELYNTSYVNVASYRVVMNRLLRALFHLLCLLLGAVVMNAGGTGLFLGAFSTKWLASLIMVLGAGILGYGIWGITKDRKS